MTPSNVERKIYQVLGKKVTLSDFEQWLYEDKAIESSNPDLYFELISFNYDSENNLKDFYDNFARYVGFYKFEAERIKNYLDSIISRDSTSANAIWAMYDLYCAGYGFLGKLGIVYGICLVDHETSCLDNDTDNILNSFYPSIISDAKNVIAWLAEEKIVFNSHANDYGVFEYADFRSETEILQGNA